MANIIIFESEGNDGYWFARVTSGSHPNSGDYIDKYEWFLSEKDALAWACKESDRQDCLQRENEMFK